MDIRTKLALSLVSISLLSMLALGTFAYRTAFELLRQVSERQLDALAESKQRDLEKVIEGWRDHVQLIRSRTRLRELVASSDLRQDPELEHEIRRILEDALGSVKSVERVTVFDKRGRAILTVGAPGNAGGLIPPVFDEPDSVHYVGTTLPDRDRVIVRFQTSLRLGDEIIGALETDIHAEDLLTVTQNYTGLGDSGESLVVMRGDANAADQAVVLMPLRHDPGLRSLRLDTSPHLRAALDGEQTVYRSGVKDYRGADVWSATRTLPDVQWGLVVKIDSAEEARRAVWLRDQMIDLGLALGALAIFGGTLLGFRLGRPLRDLRDVVHRIRSGEHDLRANASSADEVGFLAEALNDLLDEKQLR